MNRPYQPIRRKATNQPVGPVLRSYETKYNDREMTVEEHIKEFSTKWSRLTAQVSGETDISKAVRVLALFTKCDEMKAITLLESFPDYYKAVINNIATQ
jgi:hypothetical protein